MKWASALAGNEIPGKKKYGSARQLITECAESINFQLSDAEPDLVIGFVSTDFASEFEHIPELVKKHMRAKHFIGCAAGGLIGGGVEVEREKGMAFTAAVLPGVDLHTFHLDDSDLPDLDSAPDAWEKALGVKYSDSPDFILLPDPFSFKVDTLMQGLDYAFAKSVKLGGLASGGNTAGSNALFCDDKVFQSGAVGAAVSGNIIVDSVVAQGCRPIGHPMRVTKCLDNFLIELDGEPAIHVLKEAIMKLSPSDQKLAYNSLFLGVVMDEFKDDFQGGDFLIRNILGIEQRSGALMIGEVLRKERTVQFHLRDAATSADDLRVMLKQYVKNNNGDEVAGALLFSCLGRGKHLYGQANHDSDCFREYVGDVPLGGFFCNGEIGPVGGTTFLHGYTSSFGLFRQKSSAQ
ncbi:MAG TPA: FIST N-terminal domain-containing protein [Drouetiella sp.]